MDKEDYYFDINKVLMTLFSSLKEVRDDNKIELIYEIDATVPKELKGNAENLSSFLIQVLTFVLKKSTKKEIVLSLSAPKDFLYEEPISFMIKETGISKEQIVSFWDTTIEDNFKQFKVSLTEEDMNSSNIHISIPFKLNALGMRRYYRLPKKAMLGKKVLLICKSLKIAKSIEKMFKYFLYDVDVGADAYKKQGSDLTQYDIFLIDDKLTTVQLENLIVKTQKKTALKYVLLHDLNYEKSTNVKSAHLIKPVLQESIFELVVSLFKDEGKDEIKDESINPDEEDIVISMKKYATKVTNTENEINLGNSTKKESLVLDTDLGEENSKKLGTSYRKELRSFLDMFNHSDLYFRDIVNEKAINKIKEFCIDLEKQSKIIEAQKMQVFADEISHLFVYDKLETLPIYTRRYHLELKKLIIKINLYLSSK